MLVGTLQLRSALRQMVNKVTRHSALQRELMEECLGYLARLEAEAPDHAEDWYLKRCSRHLARFRYLARSWDAPKLPPSLVEKATASLHKRARTPEELHRFTEVVAALSQHLSKRETKVLSLLVEGCALEEIADSLKVDLSDILRAQSKVAALILKLGLAPKPERSRKKLRGKGPGGKVVQKVGSTPEQAEASDIILPAMGSKREPPEARVRPS